MENGKIPGVRQVSAKEVRELSKLAWVRDEALSTRMSEARVLPDGRVLMHVADGERANLFPSRAAAEEAHRRYLEARQRAEGQARRGPVDPSLGLLPPVADFLRDVELHAKKLGPRIGIADEALDGTLESLDAVDKALKKIPWAKRQVPDLVTPLVAYVGEVLRKASGGRWSKHKKREVPICDANEVIAQWAAMRRLQPLALAAGEKARTEAKARGAPAQEVEQAYVSALQAIQRQRPAVTYRTEMREDNEPLVIGHDGRICQPYAVVYLPMVEPSRRIPLRSAVDIQLRVGPPPPRPLPPAA
jgi:hypothetical protein